MALEQSSLVVGACTVQFQSGQLYQSAGFGAGLMAIQKGDLSVDVQSDDPEIDTTCVPAATLLDPGLGVSICAKVIPKTSGPGFKVNVKVYDSASGVPLVGGFNLVVFRTGFSSAPVP